MEYMCPKDLAPALSILDQNLETTIVAGGTDLMVWTKNKIVNPSFIMDVSQVAELKVVEDTQDRLFLGASLTAADLLDSGKTTNIPLGLVEAARVLGTPAVRNMATIGGNLGTSSPAGDMSTMLQGLRAKVVIQKTKGMSTKPLDGFFLGPGKNILAADELITGVHIPCSLTSRYLKIGLRKGSTISVVSVAGSLYEKEDGRVGLCLALGAVAPTPMRATRAENMFSLDKIQNLDQCGQVAASETSPISDIRASSEYRRQMVAVLVKKVLALMVQDISAAR